MMGMKEQMKYLRGKKEFEFKMIETNVPKPKHNHVLVKVLACGVCGTDLGNLKKSDEYVPLGHEISAVVVDLGEAVTKVSIGDNVVVEDMTACGTCSYCKSDNVDLCESMYSLDDQSGMGEYLSVHENMLVPYEGLSPPEATFVEPLAVCINSYLASDMPLNGNLVVWGLGPLALMTAAVAKHYNAAKVICVGSLRGTQKNQVREKAAYLLGVDKVVYSSDEDILEQINSALENRVDRVITTSPPKTLPMALEALSYGGTVVTIGLDFGEESTVPVDIDRLILNKKNIVTFIAEPAKRFHLSIDLIKKKIIPVEHLLTHIIPLHDLEEFKSTFTEDSGVIKAIIVTE
ncbi:MAG: alcohol dehydrogenase catalytic domain-containing protein [Clostridiaceae bacterium]|nr:alcohol dehydrogenase catalytic domain-containing protein [Clostridiaceae bacterium]